MAASENMLHDLLSADKISSTKYRRKKKYPAVIKNRDQIYKIREKISVGKISANKITETKNKRQKYDI